MKLRIPVATVAMLISVINMRAVAQSVPALINYQGRLTDQAGAAFAAGTYGIQFRLWDTATGSNILVWGQQQTAIVQSNGVFNVILGAPGGSPIPPALTDISQAFAAPIRFLGVTVVSSNGVTISPAPEILPRQQILTAPFAFSAQTAALASSIPDGSVTTSKLVDGAITTAKVADASITGVKLADQAVSSAKLQDGSITISKLNQMANSMPKTTVSRCYSAIDASAGFTNVFSLNGPGILTGISLKSDLYNPGGASFANYTIRITVDGNQYSLGGVYIGSGSAYSYHIVSGIWQQSPQYTPPTFQYFAVANSVGTAFDFSIMFSSSLAIDLRNDSNSDGRNCFYVATSYRN